MVAIFLIYYRAKYGLIRGWFTLLYLVDGYSLDAARLGAYFETHAIWQRDMAAADAEADQHEESIQ